MKFILYYPELDIIKKVNKEDVIYELYYGKSVIPPKKIIKRFNLDPEIVSTYKKIISSIDNYIPMYDIKSQNTYIIQKGEDLFKLMKTKNFRLPNNLIYSLIKNKFDSLLELEKTTKLDEDTIIKKRMLFLSLNFLSNFDFRILENTFIHAIYKYTKEIGKNITYCIKPSYILYLKHHVPYYQRDEIINLALNMKLIKPDNKYYGFKELVTLCEKVSNNDINSYIIYKHQKHIEYNFGKYAIQYYSLNGSFDINNYLRKVKSNTFKDLSIEKQIVDLWSLITSTPAFDKNYTVYRFVFDDSFMRNIKIGETFMDKGFVSTTRNPFYDIGSNHFGYILLIIKLPKDIPGIGLCVESYSVFPNEQEIILPPKTKLRLLSIDDDYTYYHTNLEYQMKIKRKYEFELVTTDKSIEFNKDLLIEHNISEIDFMKVNIIGETLIDKILYFHKNYVNRVDQFICLYKSEGNVSKLKMSGKFYNSTNAYKDHYYFKTEFGYNITLYDSSTGRVLLFIELNQNSIMSVNYYFKFTDINGDFAISDEMMLNIISVIGYAFSINEIIIHPYYNTCLELMKNSKYELLEKEAADIMHYNIDFYNYLKKGKKRFMDVPEIVPNFFYFQLDKLKKHHPLTILDATDNDNLHRIYRKAFNKENPEASKKETLKDFYLFVCENYFDRIEQTISKMYRLYKINNPFENNYYSFNPYFYLFRKEIIQSIPIDAYKFVDYSNYEHTFGHNIISTRYNRYDKKLLC